MKRIIAFVMAAVLAMGLTGCDSRPVTYDFYTGFRLPVAEEIQRRDTEGYTDITNDEFNSYFREEMGMDSIISHQIFKQKKAVVANFTVNGASQIQLIRNYVYETFWQGNLHFITGGLPYEDWQHKTHIKTLYLQIWCPMQEHILLQDVYTFDKLEMSGFKAFELETRINEAEIFDDQYVSIEKLLNTDREKAARWLDAEQYLGKKYRMEMHTSLLDNSLIIDICTPKQLPPENLAPLHSHMYEKLKAIDTDITINLYRGQSLAAYEEFYYSYSSTEGLPVAKTGEK